MLEEPSQRTSDQAIALVAVHPKAVGKNVSRIGNEQQITDGFGHRLTHVGIADLLVCLGNLVEIVQQLSQGCFHIADTRLQNIPIRSERVDERETGSPPS